jgi:hypothetical protein
LKKERERYIIWIVDITHAKDGLNKFNIPCHKGRHPAQGGKNSFSKGVKR